MPVETPLRDVRIWPAEVAIERRADGAMLVRSPRELPAYPARTLDRLAHWAAAAPNRVFMAERARDGHWREITYARALETIRAIAASLLKRGLSAQRPVLILSGNALDHAMLALGAQYAGIAHAPVSPAYSLISSDFAKLRHIARLLTPGLVYAAHGERFASAIRAAVPDDVELVVSDAPPPGRRATPFVDLCAAAPVPGLDAAHAATGPDSVVKLLFTSGSTGLPKAVINTERMMTSNQAMIEAALGFLSGAPPVIVDWLPWNHTFGGNHNIGIIIRHGGTMYLDAGKPTPDGIGETIRNLRDIAPTVYFNVPKGFEALIPALERDAGFARHFFSRLNMNFFAGAGLSAHVWDALDQIALKTCGERIFMMSGLGATETAPSALFCTRESMRSGAVGLPLPGIGMKLVPNGRKLECRLRGPNITPGYWRQPDLTAAAFDEEGYYRLGDALRFADPAEPKLGFFFDGRLSEDFKLSTGTWVSVGPLRARFIAAFAPLAKDVVIAGHERDEVGALVLPDLEALRALAPGSPDDALFDHAAVRAAFQDKFDAFAAASTGSSTRITRAALLCAPPSIDAHEVTDKGSINQRAVLDNRASLVSDLYADPPPPHVFRLLRRS